jgi:hypothetical protein
MAGENTTAGVLIQAFKGPKEAQRKRGERDERSFRFGHNPFRKGLIWVIGGARTAGTYW